MSIYDRNLQEGTLFDMFQADAYTDTIKALKLAEQEIIAKILSIKGDTWTKRQLQEIRKLINAEITKAYAGTLPVLQNQLPGIVEITASNMMRASFTKVPVSVIDAITSNSFLVQGYEAKDLFKTLSDNHARQLRVLVSSGVAQGKTSNTIINELITKNSSLSKGQLRNAIFTTITDARAVSRYDSYHQMEKSGVIKGYEYVATLDSHTTEYCRNHDNRRYYKPIDEIIKYINVHFHCLVGGSTVSSVTPIKLITKRMYKGKIYTITTSKGNKLSCTPNHPIFTNRGFLRANEINQSDKIGTNNREITSSCNVNNNQGVSTIEDLFASFLKTGKMLSMKVPASPEDFHGDIGFDENVDIVYPDSLLCDSFISSIDNGLIDNSFHRRLSNAFIKLYGFTPLLHGFNSLYRASCSIMGGSNLFGSLFGRHKRPLHRFLLRSSSKFNSLTHKFSRKKTNSNIEPISNTTYSDTMPIESDCTLKNEDPMKPSLHIEGDSSTLPNYPIDDLFGKTKLFSDISSGAFGDEVLFDDIVSIEIRDEMCHVYNLENELHYYAANNIINHNCRSIFVPLTDSTTKTTRASQFGVVPDESYGVWFIRQSDSFKRTTLGRKKFNLYKSGYYKVGGLADVKGRTLSLETISKTLQKAAEEELKV